MVQKEQLAVEVLLRVGRFQALRYLFCVCGNQAGAHESLHCQTQPGESAYLGKSADLFVLEASVGCLCFQADLGKLEWAPMACVYAD